MSQRLNEYFAKEASEYLDQLEGLLRLAGRPDPEQFLRLATGVRGSAQMAGAETVAGVAERLEDAARSILSSAIAWSDEIRSLSQQTVADLKLLVRALNRWGQEEERRVRAAIERWDEGQGIGSRERGAGASLRVVVPVSDLFYDDEGPHVLEVGADPTDVAGGVVSIAELLYRGDAALDAALGLRDEVEEALADGSAGKHRLTELVEELFDLIELARAPESAEA